MNSLDESKTETGASSDRESSYSTTNTQVQGVDESDIKSILLLYEESINDINK